MTDSLPKTILCDFDGTITRACLCDFLYERFASCGLKYSDMWAEGKIGTKEEIETSFQFIKASREEMEQALKTIPMVPGFKQFYEFCKANAWELVIVSDSLEWAIRYVLGQAGITDIRVMANQIFFEGEGYRFDFPYFNPAAPKAGVRKLDVARRFKGEGKLVYLIGDGRTDFEATQAADFIFARDALWEYCLEKQLPSFHYEDFFDILQYAEHPANHF